MNTTPAPRQVICPTCLDRFPWDESELLEYSVKEGRYQPIDLAGISNPVKRRDLRSRCYVRCPNPSKDAGESHYLPVTYVDYEDPLFVALAGRPRSGKTHLLVALVNHLVNGSASVCGLSATAVDTRLHAHFKRRLLTPFRRGDQLPGTGDELGRYAAWLLIETPRSRRPVVFFDVAGEDFRHVGERGRNTRFLLNAGALMFIEDATHVVPESAEQQDIEMEPTLGGGNEWINEALARLDQVNGQGKSLPAAVVLTKCDRLRYLPPVDRWLREDCDGRLSARSFLEESRDVYAVLHRSQATAMTSLYARFDRCTLHFVSATGVAARDGTYPGGTQPARVLQPLIALLAMAGVLTGSDADRVGR